MIIPFRYGKIVSGDSFINREDEINRLRQNFESGINTLIISSRRWGKSSLVWKVADELNKRKDIRVCYIDLFSVRTEKEFLTLFAREVIKATSSKWEEWAEIVKALLKNVAPKISFGSSQDMQPELELGWMDKNPDTLSVFDLPEAIAKRKNVRIVVCIDEFQNLSYFEDPTGIQKQMRSVWQRHQSASYCLFGSKRHIITDFFTNQSMPFYRFGDLMFLDKIERSHWEKFIQDQFSKHEKTISPELADSIADTVKLHPYYVQQLAQKVWLHSGKIADKNSLKQGLEALLNDSSIAFQRDIENLTVTQINFLKALCQGVKEFTSMDVLSSYALGSQGNIARIKKALEQKDILDFFRKDPVFVDPVFEIWFRKIFL